MTENDSKPLIAEVCNELRNNKHSPEVQEALEETSKLTKLIDCSIRKKLHNHPDPELVVVFNQFLCTYGVLPWSTSFAEFHCIDRGNYTTVEDYTSVMYKYSKCEQRFGK